MNFYNEIDNQKQKEDIQLQLQHEEQKCYKKLVRIDHCTWVDLNKIIGCEINYKKKADKEYFEVILGYQTKESLEGEEFNSSLIGIVPWLQFDTFDEAKQYLKDIGIELTCNKDFKFNKTSWKFRNQTYKYGLELNQKIFNNN